VNWKNLAIVVALLAACALAWGCTDDENGGPGSDRTFVDNPTEIPGLPPVGGFPLEIPRSDGKTLTIAQPPQRVISLSPAATEIMYALGVEGALVAVDNQADYPPAAAAFATKVDAFEPNVEAIAGLAPELVIVANNNGGIVEALDGLNFPVYYQDIDTSITTIADVFVQIALLGRIFDKSDRASEMTSELGARVQRIEDGVRGENTASGPKIYHELDSTFFTVSENTFIGDLYKTLRVRNIAGAGGGQSYPQMTQEAIIASNPAVIILADEEFGVTVESVKARPGWDAIDAVVNDRIYGIDPDIISRPGPRIIDALEQLARLIYPTRFQ
jgi:iron complex transport system substrate-binding protein